MSSEGVSGATRRTIHLYQLIEPFNLSRKVVYEAVHCQAGYYVVVAYNLAGPETLSSQSVTEWVKTLLFPRDTLALA